MTFGEEAAPEVVGDKQQPEQPETPTEPQADTDPGDPAVEEGGVTEGTDCSQDDDDKA